MFVCGDAQKIELAAITVDVPVNVHHAVFRSAPFERPEHLQDLSFHTFSFFIFQMILATLRLEK